jgi:hypothetical protein
MEDRKGSPLTEDPSSEGPVEQLDRQQKTLRDFLDSIEDDARLMDASAEDAHQIAVSICKMVKEGIFGPDGALDRFSYQDAYNIFERTRADENDIYEIYADDLQRHQKRQRKDLGVAESDSDKFVVVTRRRGYISTLTALQAQVSDILDLLPARRICGE